MFIRKFAISAPIFLFIFIIQEAFVSQLRLVGGGFSLFFIFTIIWCALSIPEIGAMVGFGAGLLMDLSQSTSGPMGHWTLVMILTGFAAGYLGYGDNNFRGNPISLILLTSAAIFVARFIYYISGLLLGSEAGSILHTFALLIGQSIWTLVIAPFLVPVVTFIHGLVYETRSRI